MWEQTLCDECLMAVDVTLSALWRMLLAREPSGSAHVIARQGRAKMLYRCSWSRRLRCSFVLDPNARGISCRVL